MRLFLGLLLLFATSCSVYKEKCDGVSDKIKFLENSTATKNC